MKTKVKVNSMYIFNYLKKFRDKRDSVCIINYLKILSDKRASDNDSDSDSDKDFSTILKFGYESIVYAFFYLIISQYDPHPFQTIGDLSNSK